MRRQLRICLCVMLAVALGCGRSEEASRQTEATHSANDQDLHVSDEALHTIQLKTAKVQSAPVAGMIEATGWLVARPPTEVVVKAPATGFVRAIANEPLSVGSSVKKDEPLAAIHVFLAPHEQSQIASEKADAITQIEQSQATAKTASEQLDRIESTAAGAVSGARIAELRETLARAKASETHAREKLQAMTGTARADSTESADIPVTSPTAGRLINVHFVPKLFVLQGDPLWTIADWSRLWVQVSVFPTDASRIDRRASATVNLPGVKKSLTAKPVDVTQSVEPGKQTVALIYEIANDDYQLRPGQAVGASLQLEQKGSALTIPSSAILWDGMDNSWVYLKIAANRYRRRKVELLRVQNGDAIIGRGLSAGDEVVVEGAEPLHGEEFKDQIPAGDND